MKETMRSRWQILPVLLVVAALVAAACGQTATPAPTASGTPKPSAAPATTAAPAAATGGNFRFGQSGDIAALDPWNVTDGNSLLVTRQIFETLVDYEPTGFKIVPKLATKWEASADGKTWTFTLRDGVKFHDGTAFDAAAVVTNFDRAKNTKDALRPSKPVADDFAYSGDMWKGFDNDSVIAKVEAKSANTVVFTLKSSFGPFLA
ncbi:MAG: ABC transporter substrate-binding protein, partial [Candidatus Limnocylindria bacterium]|nr:ABC transporter substrate-binding protein [Candidatus Limnocylindria bacterium]